MRLAQVFWFLHLLCGGAAAAIAQQQQRAVGGPFLKVRAASCACACCGVCPRAHALHQWQHAGLSPTPPLPPRGVCALRAVLCLLWLQGFLFGLLGVFEQIEWQYVFPATQQAAAPLKKPARR